MNISSIRFSSFAENSFLSNVFSSSTLSKKIAMIAAAAFAAYLCFCTCRHFYYQWKKVEDGPGKIVSFFGDVVEGEFKNGQLNGQGKMERFFKVEEGEFKGGQLNGQGKICSRRIWPIVVEVSGEFRNGDFTGQGFATVDLGFFKMETMADFENIDLEGRPKGVGKIIHKESLFSRPIIITQSEGEFKSDGLFEGKRTFQDGQVEEGTFKDAKLHGKGKTTFADGRVEEGTYEYGLLVG